MDFDRLTAEELVARGSGKWTRFPGKIGAYVAEMDFGVAPVIQAALHDLVDNPKFGYMAEWMDAELREASAGYLARFGWQVDPAAIVPGPDVLSVLHWLCRSVLSPDAKVIVPTPAYMPFLTIPPAHGHQVVQVPMLETDSGWEYDFDQLDAVFGEGDLLVLCNPHNPIGKVPSAAELTRISEIVEAHHGWVYNDEIHSGLVFPAGPAMVPYHALNEATAEHTATVFAASKTWNIPGLKCAQAVVTSSRLRDAWTSFSAWRWQEASTPGVVATTVAYREGYEWLDEVLAYLDGNRRRMAELVAEHLPGVRYKVPEGTYLAWLDCSALGLANPYQTFFDDADVALIDGLACGAVGEGHVRLNMATPRPVLEQMVRQMGQAVQARA